MLRAANAFPFNIAGGVAETGGINEVDRVAVESNEFLDGVTGGAGMGGDNGAIAASQKIKESGFADIRSAGDDNPCAFAQQMAFVPGVQQGLNTTGNGGNPGRELFRNGLGQFIIREIKHGLNISAQGEQCLIKRPNFVSQGIFELGRGQTGGALGTGMDEV